MNPQIESQQTSLESITKQYVQQFSAGHAQREIDGEFKIEHLTILVL